MFLVASVLLIFLKFFCVDISFIRNRIDIDIVLLETVVVFNATFNNISAISWRSVLLVEETGVPGENHRPVASHKILY